TDSFYPDYFAANKYYRYVEWSTSSAGGSPAPTAPATVSTACQGSVDAAPPSGTGLPSLTPAQKARCQQCVDEAGYYIRPNTSSGVFPANTTGSVSNADRGLWVFKGNWLNFYPPKFLLARKVLTDFIAAQSNTATPVRIGVATYDPAARAVTCTNLSDFTCMFSEPPAGTGPRPGDGGHLVSAGMVPDCGVTSWVDKTTHTPIAAQQSLIDQVRSIDWANGHAAQGGTRHTPLAETLLNVGQFL